ncbi:spore germination protein [Pullulanibacillus sp. KACC 23026]|uniref:spore germination protein n=1 Tax=Pullulanibacillus sp. KACC 23026 TaxID=3028315 RepID=UPI0023AFA83B|nr:spore germination protein [Pullulanibacillus sp. KACC 23026]WEG11008.1 spore germination protein [Pullulanibacillus sp. KACC 23026]
MPSFYFNPIKIDSIGSGAQVNFGDVLNISPKAMSKSISGSGAFETGDFQVHYEWFSLTNTIDSDGSDQTIAANN